MSWKTKTLPVVFGLIVLSGSTATRGEESRDPSHFTYARLYCAPDGNTHFQDVTVDLSETDFAPPAPPIHIGSDFTASRAFFGGFDAGWGARDLESRLNHPTPATEFGIVLQGIFSITTTDGETRRLPPGSVFRLEDTSPARDTSPSSATSLDSYVRSLSARRNACRESLVAPPRSRCCWRRSRPRARRTGRHAR